MHERFRFLQNLTRFELVSMKPLLQTVWQNHARTREAVVGDRRREGTRVSMSWELRAHLNKHGKRPPPKRASNKTPTSPDFLPSLLMWTWFTRRCWLFAWRWKRHQRRTDRKSELSLVLRSGNVPALCHSPSSPRYIFPSSISLKPPTANRKYTIFSLKNICKTVYSYNSVDLPRLHKNPRWDAMQWDADDSVDGAGSETGWCDIQQTFHGIHIYSYDYLKQYTYRSLKKQHTYLNR